MATHPLAFRRLVAATAAVLVALGVLGALQLWPSGGAPPAASGGPAASQSATPDAEPEAPVSPSTEPESEPEPAATSQSSQEPPPEPEPSTPDAPAVPEGLEPYTDESGFSIAVPAGWQREPDDDGVRFEDPASGRYLLVAQTDDPKPDALADWEAQEPYAAQRLEGYERVGMERISLPGVQDAADWEFRHSGVVRVVNRNLITGPDKAYAVYFSGREETWDADRATFDAVAGTFTPAR